jgi:hypothetical protein
MLSTPEKDSDEHRGYERHQHGGIPEPVNPHMLCRCGLSRTGKTRQRAMWRYCRNGRKSDQSDDRQKRENEKTSHYLLPVGLVAKPQLNRKKRRAISSLDKNLLSEEKYLTMDSSPKGKS